MTPEDMTPDFVHIDKVLEFDYVDREKSVKIEILDDEEWEPDENFYLEIYDLQTKARLPGEDTRTTVLILDDDKPGIFSFEKKTYQVRAKDKQAKLKVIR